MSVSASIIDIEDGTAVAVEKLWSAGGHIESDQRHLVTTSPQMVHGTFKSTSFTAAGTTQLVIPNDDGSLILTGLVVTGDKVNAASIEVGWTDDVDTAIILKPTVTDAPVAVAMTFASRVQGWADARIDVIVVGNVSGSVMATYIKVPAGISFAEWDALR